MVILKKSIKFCFINLWVIINCRWDFLFKGIKENKKIGREIKFIVYFSEFVETVCFAWEVGVLEEMGIGASWGDLGYSIFGFREFLEDDDLGYFFLFVC